MTNRISIINKAHAFAKAAHGATGQLRKYTGDPYIVHPVAVAVLVSSVPHTESMVAAALLHDVVEDTMITVEMIREDDPRRV